MIADVLGRVRRVVWGGVVLAGTAAVLAPEAAAQITWDRSEWEVPEGARFEEYLGRDAMVIEGGTAWLNDVELRDGVIEFDIAMSSDLGFNGLRFRAVDGVNHEYVYLRPHLSGQPDATQYTPIDNGLSGWHMYTDPRYALPAAFTPDRWMHVRVGIQGRRMEMTVDGQPLVYPALDREPVAGAIGLTGSSARFANFVARPGANPEFSNDPGAPPVDAEPGTVMTWRVSDSFAESVVDGVRELPGSVTSAQRWTEMPTHVRGITNIAKTRVRSEEANTVFAAVTLTTDIARTVRVRIGFSDRVRAFLNGRQLFAGADGYATRDYRFLGSMGLFDELFLPLEAGDNEIWLAISEDFGGWGVTMQVPEGQGVVVR